jgi:tetratricopeptide (TPR) repeat protein
MQPTRTCAVASALLALALALIAPSARAQDAVGPTLGVLSIATDPSLEPIARGADLWLRDQLAAAGIVSIPLAGSHELGMAAAAQQRLSRVIAPRLASFAGRVTAQLPLIAPESGALLGGARAEQTVGEVGSALATALDALLAQLGVAPSAPTAPPQLDDLASASRALAAWESGEWTRAWREVQGRLSPTSMALREEIVEAARSGEGEMAQRARVLAAAGDPIEAARLVGRTASEALRAEAPDPSVLIAGGEVALARDDPAAAREYFERALGRDAANLDATLGLGRALALQRDAAAAERALLRAAELAPTDPQPLVLLAETRPEDPSSARHWLEAARRSARQLEVQRARVQVERAVALDPTLAGEASWETGTLEERLGRPAQALAAYRRAAGAGLGTPELLVATGRTQRALGQVGPARTTLEAALAKSPDDPKVLSELGALHLEQGAPTHALAMLQAAYRAESDDPQVRQRYARALQANGQVEESIALLRSDGAGPRELRLAAQLQSDRGDASGASESLARAIQAEPLDPTLRTKRAELLESMGDAAAARAERQLAALLEGGSDGDTSEGQPAESDAVGALSLDELVASFAAKLPRGERHVVSLGAREPGTVTSWLWRLVRPRGPDRGHIEAGLRTAVEARFGKSFLGEETFDDLAVHIDRLYDFEEPHSLDAQTVSAVNQVLATDAIFVARVLPDRPFSEALCEPGDFAIEMRLLAGRDPELVSALSNRDCVQGGMRSYGAWNWPAFALYALAALLIGWPVIRGWGSIQVDIKLPERTRGFFSIHITKRADAVKKERVDKKTNRKKMKAGALDFLKRFERHMAGRSTLFRMIPVRAVPYTVTVAGPLLDARGEEIIGHFMEEQRVSVKRGLVTKLEFDFCPRECAVEVKVLRGERPAVGGRVAVEGDPSSLRYARDGTAYLYLGAGRYTILVGCKDAAVGLPLTIESVQNAIPLRVDFDHSEGLVFTNCPQAVDPYLQSDLASAAAALEANGQTEPAHRLRAALYRRQGRHDEAAREFEAGGSLEDAAAMRASGEDFGGSAELYEQAGDFGSAGEAYRAAGDFAKAASCYERAYDYARAIECWREVGDREREQLLQEKLGEYLEAARLAREQGDTDRALALLGNVEARHADFPQACRLVAEIASERGDHDLAISKLEEALGESGMEAASPDMLEAYAGALDRADRHTQALSAYETLRRRDMSRTDIAPHIQRLRREIAATQAASQAGAGSASSASTRKVESRYELLEEIGRGGMGVVYKARDKRLGRIVALKRLPENLKRHPQAVELFEREARAAAALNHRNIVTLFDAGEEDGSYFLSMELLEGRALNAILAKSKKLRAGDVLRLGVQICAGLHFAHERKIVHRDIKCANLFFTNERVVKIMDFGIAKSLEEVRRQATVIGGTPYYMAPEQAAGDAVDHRTDLYALGVTLFQLVTGELPFADGDINYRHRHEQPPNPREMVLDIPERLAKLILALMAKRPQDRPGSAAEVGEILRALHAEQGR